jgi:hypothetical protein
LDAALIFTIAGIALALGAVALVYLGRRRKMTLKKELARAKDLAIWLHTQTNDVDLQNTDFKHRMGFALFQQSLDVDDGINVLLENNLPGPAMALARPRFEGYVRGLWLLRAATDDAVEKFQNGICPHFNVLMNQIGGDAETGGAWIKANADANLKDFHDLTHGGMSHVLRRVNAATIEPSYPERELISLVRFGLEIKVRIGVELLAWTQNESAINQLQQRAIAIRNAP